MNRIFARLAAIGCLLALTACAKFYEPTPKVNKVDDAWLISKTASLSATLVRRPQSDFLTCAEPPPDAAFDQGEAANTKFTIISLGGGDDSGGESETSDETEMAGRTPGVLMSRELFFRACEFSQNYKLNKEEALKLYNRTLDIIDKNWATEAAQTTVTIGDKVISTGGSVVKVTQSQSDDASGKPAATPSTDSTGSSSDSGYDDTSSTP